MSYFIVALMATSLSAQALDIDCEKESLSFVKVLVDADLVSGDEADIEKNAVIFCQFVVNRAEQARSDDANSEFAEWLAHGENADKPGNRRLKRLK